MKTKRNLIAVSAICIAIFSATVAAKQQYSENVVDTSLPLPRGEWTFSAHPDFLPGWKTALVLASSVLTEASKGLTITRIGVTNRSSHRVAAVKLIWSLSSQSGQRVHQTGLTPFISMTDGLQSQRTQVVDFPLVTFAKVAQKLIKDGTLKGDFQVDVAVTEIFFENGSTWKRGEMRAIGDITLYQQNSKSDGCAQQKCSWSTAKSAYECISSTNKESCSPRGDDECLNSSCEVTN